MAGSANDKERLGRSAVTAALIGGTAAWNVLQNRIVPRGWYPAFNAIGSAVVLGAGRAAGLTLDNLGLGPGSVRRGLRVGLPAAAVIAAGGAAGVAHPSTRSWFRDDRVIRAGTLRLLSDVVVRIPVGTALFEELVFRGLLLAWFEQSWGRRMAVNRSSALFGAWHVLPSVATVAVYRDGALQLTPARRFASVAASVVVTGLAGRLLAVARIRTRSLAAPIVVHAALNVVGYLAAWIAADGRARDGEPDSSTRTA